MLFFTVKNCIFRKKRVKVVVHVKKFCRIVVHITKKKKSNLILKHLHIIIIYLNLKFLHITGKSFSEALILASTNPKYDKRLFIDLPVQYMKTTSSEHVVYINCSECQNKNKKQFVYTTCSALAIFIY